MEVDVQFELPHLPPHPFSELFFLSQQDFFSDLVSVFFLSQQDFSVFGLSLLHAKTSLGIKKMPNTKIKTI
ncbi:hypothetical protein FLJC2902T_18780 [Flavobacterium limnosediminis JC2902]|uniref:Uncharacterized protein n=1 Tax=Flavobacterium limnosediminis JC2902 TaxID=1341181 RepID=V6SPW9_9FLAO|nr:hypothetical protein FLJC2902T_18780 [Flavobacterium limnosediminis JC2902]